MGRLDEVFLTINDGQGAIRVELANVARFEPALFGIKVLSPACHAISAYTVIIYYFIFTFS